MRAPVRCSADVAQGADEPTFTLRTLLGKRSCEEQDLLARQLVALAHRDGSRKCAVHTDCDVVHACSALHATDLAHSAGTPKSTCLYISQAQTRKQRRARARRSCDCESACFAGPLHAYIHDTSMRITWALMTAARPCTSCLSVGDHTTGTSRPRPLSCGAGRC